MSFMPTGRDFMEDDLDEPIRCTRCGNGEAMDPLDEDPICEYCQKKDEARNEASEDHD
jgi:DNA-directed RNA polymerase subunit RPC12/RpoP